MFRLLNSLRSHLQDALNKWRFMTHADRQLSELIFHTDNANGVTFSHLEVCYLDHCEDDELFGCYISHVDFCKSPKYPNHEYIVAHIYRKDQVGRTATQVGCIRVERFAGSRSHNGSTSTLTGSSRASSPTGSSSSSRSKQAHDSAKVIDRLRMSRNDEDFVCSSPRDAGPIPLIKLIAAGFVLGEERPNYSVLNGQCYWFAGLVFCFLVGENANEIVKKGLKEKQDVAGAGRLAFVRRVLRPRASVQSLRAAGKIGKVFSITSDVDIKRDYKNLLEKFDRKVGELSSAIEEKRNTQNKLEQLLAEERRLRALAEQRVHELERATPVVHSDIEQLPT